MPNRICITRSRQVASAGAMSISLGWYRTLTLVVACSPGAAYLYSGGGQGKLDLPLNSGQKTCLLD